MLTGVGNRERTPCSTTSHRQISTNHVKTFGIRDSSVPPAGLLLDIQEQLSDLDVHQRIFKVVKPKI